jgi:hypothetical protein
MNIVKVGEVYKATRITGPQHNYLGLVLSETGVESVTIEPLSVDTSEVAVETLDDQQLFDAVQRGVTEANKALGTRFRIARLQYVPTDTPNPATYSTLAQYIVEYASREAHLKAPARTSSQDD